MTLGLRALHGHDFPFGESRQDALLIGEFGLGVVCPLDVRATKARELDAKSRRAQTQIDGTLEVHDRRQRRHQSDLVLSEFGVDHLGRDRALPDEVIHGKLVAV